MWRITQRTKYRVRSELPNLPLFKKNMTNLKLSMSGRTMLGSFTWKECHCETEVKEYSSLPEQARPRWQQGRVSKNMSFRLTASSASQVRARLPEKLTWLSDGLPEISQKTDSKFIGLDLGKFKSSFKNKGHCWFRQLLFRLLYLRKFLLDTPFFIIIREARNFLSVLRCKEEKFTQERLSHFRLS